MLPLIPAIILLVLCMYQVCLCGLDRHAEEKLDQFSTPQQRGKLCSTALGTCIDLLFVLLVVAAMLGTCSLITTGPPIDTISDPNSYPTTTVPFESSWRGCTEKCGSGVQSAVITAPGFGGPACPSPKIRQACNTHPCAVECVPSWSPWTSCIKSCGTGIKTLTIIVDTAAAHGDGECRTEMDRTCNYDTGIETLPKGLGASFPYGLLKYAVLGTTADPNAFPTAAPLFQMDTHAAVLPQTISYAAPLTPAHQPRSTMAAEESSPPNEADALASNVLLQTASNSAPSARNKAQVSTTIVHCSA